MKNNKIHLNLLFFTLFFLITDCSFYSEPKPSIDQVAFRGWEYFLNGDYDEALSKFSDIIYDAPEDELGFHGKGWCKLLLNDPDDSITNFDLAISFGNYTNDPIAGLAIAYHASGDYLGGIVYCKELLQNNPSYYFEHQPLINYQDIRIILAMCYYHEGELTLAQEQADFLAEEQGNLQYNPLDIALDVEDETTWIIADTQYNSYAEALMALIDYLDSIYGM